jgi:uncharacterized DUF497 family protein
LVQYPSIVTIHYNFEWDPAKARANLKKHGVSFEQATAVFRDPRALSVYDEEHNDQEDRWVTLGWPDAGTLLVVCHTFAETSRGSEITLRIISARKATRAEQEEYERNL